MAAALSLCYITEEVRRSNLSKSMKMRSSWARKCCNLDMMWLKVWSSTTG